MAILNQVEFAAVARISVEALGEYIAREKVIVNKDGTLDDDKTRNKRFVERHSKAAALRELRARQEAALDGVDLKNPSAAKMDSDQALILFDKLEKEKMEAQLEETRGRTLKLKLQNEKMLGNFLPTGAVQFLVTQLSEAINLAWENEFEDAMMAIAKKYGIEREEIMQLKRSKVGICNAARERAIQNAKTMIRRLEGETASKRDRGQHG